jgi:hypothetical protein
MKRIKYDAVSALIAAGITKDDASALRRISMTLRAWFEHECNGTIQRDETTGKPHFYREDSRGVHHKSGIVPDREAGAMRRLLAIMARYPTLTHYVQGDPRGCALYILRPGDVLDGQQTDSYYSRGIAVY